MIACKHSISEIADIIGADTLSYLPTEELKTMIGNGDYCRACFDGRYPTPILSDTRKDRFEQKLSSKNKRK